MSKFAFTGTGVALITPFRKQDTIDFSRLENLINTIIASGVEYIVALGTTSEAATMTDNERSALRDFIIETTAGRVPVVLGVGGNNTRQIADTIAQTNFDGICGILSVAPYYNKPNQKGLVQHFSHIAEVSPVPVILYNVPGRTSCNMLAETTIRIAESNPNVIGIKEASGNVKQILYLLNHKPKDFLVISGDDLITLPLMAAGMDGLISVLANAYPAETANMVHLAMNDQFIKARLYHDKLFDISQACFKEGNPSGIKAILAAQGKIKNVLRLPLVPVSDNLSNEIHKLVQL